jgi:hypothetical protein
VASAVSALAIAAGAILVAGGTAHASGKCAWLGSGGDSTALNLCIDYDPAGYSASVYIPPSSNVVEHWLDFNLDCNNGRVFGDQGAFQAGPDQSYPYTFSVGSQGTCYIHLIDRTSSVTYYGYSVNR